MESGAGKPNKRSSHREEVEELLGRLDLHEDDGDEFVWEDEEDLPKAQAKWLASARVHTSKSFSPSALYADMRSAWNPARDVRWCLIDMNLFTVQFGCLADWNTAMTNGP